MDYSKLLPIWNKNAIRFENGLNVSEIDEIEKIYGINIPNSLKEFFECCIPVSDEEYGFPNWGNFSNENVNRIRERINAPYRWLMTDVLKHNFWLKCWGERPHTSEDISKRYAELCQSAPTLIPIFSHRYMPVIKGLDNPPILSSVGRDTVYYGRNLEEYLEIEFLNLTIHHFDDLQPIPFWSDVIIGNK